jgi:hypothetical protein
MRHVFQVKSAMTWHYICAKPNPRLLKYQLLTAHTHAATVEDQFNAPQFNPLGGILALSRFEARDEVFDALRQSILVRQSALAV